MRKRGIDDSADTASGYGLHRDGAGTTVRGVTVRGRLTLIAVLAAGACGAIAASTWSQYLAMQALETRLIARRSIAPRDPDLTELLEYSQNLGLLIALAITGLVALVMICGFMLRSAVLVPLVELAQQLRRVAREGLAAGPIPIRGPREIARVAHDAELMRRALQAQARATRAAEDGLSQQAPLVVALRERQPAGIQRIGPALIASSLEPARGVIGGDWWQVVPWHERGVALLIGDVIGHGEQAALVAYALRTSLTGALASGTPATVLPQLGCQVLRGCHDSGVDLAAASCAVLLLDVQSAQLHWINAGHPAPIITSIDGSMHDCAPTGPWLTTFGGTWSMRSQQCTTQDVILAFTDGLTAHDMDTDSADGELGLRNAMRRSVQHWFASGAPYQDFGKVVDEVRRAMDTNPVGSRRDDLALIALTSHK